MVQHSISPLFEGDPRIDGLFAFQRPSGFLHRVGQRQIIERIREGQFDLGLLLTNSFSSAWWFWRGGVKRRIGSRNTPLQGEHQVEKYLSLLRPLGYRGEPGKLQLFITRDERESAKRRLRLLGAQGKKVIGIHSSAAYGTAKCWPPERFRALAERLVNLGYFVVFVGDNKAAPEVHEIIRDLPVTSLAGKTTLRELMALIACCDLFISNDSGPMHVAAALDVPVIALFGSTDPVKTGPYGCGFVISEKVSCGPCFQRNCPLDFRCMQRIEVDDVLFHVKRLLLCN